VLWSRDCFNILPFVVMLRVARVCQRQLSYFFLLPAAKLALTKHGSGVDVKWPLTRTNRYFNGTK